MNKKILALICLIPALALTGCKAGPIEFKNDINLSKGIKFNFSGKKKPSTEPPQDAPLPHDPGMSDGYVPESEAPLSEETESLAADAPMAAASTEPVDPTAPAPPGPPGPPTAQEFTPNVGAQTISNYQDYMFTSYYNYFSQDLNSLEGYCPELAERLSEIIICTMLREAANGSSNTYSYRVEETTESVLDLYTEQLSLKTEMYPRTNLIPGKIGNKENYDEFIYNNGQPDESYIIYLTNNDTGDKYTYVFAISSDGDEAASYTTKDVITALDNDDLTGYGFIYKYGDKSGGSAETTEDVIRLIAPNLYNYYNQGRESYLIEVPSDETNA